MSAEVADWKGVRSMKHYEDTHRSWVGGHRFQVGEAITSRLEAIALGFLLLLGWRPLLKHYEDPLQVEFCRMSLLGT